MKRYAPGAEVDFVIVGSGSAGGVMARELSRAGFSVIVLEQGPWLTTPDFKHDELWTFVENGITNHPKDQPNTFRETESETAKVQAGLPVRTRGGRRLAALHRELLALPRDRVRAGDASSACPTARRSRTGRSSTPISSRTTRRSSGKSASRASPAIRSSRRGGRAIQCRHCRSNRKACSWSAARRSSAGTPGRRRWRSCRSPSAGARRASRAASASRARAKWGRRAARSCR